MKAKITLCLLLTLTALLASCDKTPANGKLDGMWQLMETCDIAPDGTVSAPVSRKDEGIYWSIQLQMLNIHTQHALLNGHSYDTTARIVCRGNRLELISTYIHFDNRDSLLTDPQTPALEPLGIRGNTAVFTIVENTRSRLVLESGYNRLTFRKF